MQLSVYNYKEHTCIRLGTDEDALYGESFCDPTDVPSIGIGVCVALLKATREKNVAWPWRWPEDYISRPPRHYRLSSLFVIKLMYWRQRYAAAFAKARTRDKEDELGKIRFGYAEKMLYDLWGLL